MKKAINAVNLLRGDQNKFPSDISARKGNGSKPQKTKRMLTDPELRYRRLFETVREGIMIVDAASGCISDVNPYLLNLLGYAQDEFIGQQFLEMDTFKECKTSNIAFEAMMKNESSLFVDLPLRTKNGQRLHVACASYIFQVAGEKVLQCNIRDITSQKQAQTSLYKSEKKFHSLINAISYGIYICDRKGVFTYSNRALAQICGYKHPEELIGRNIIEILPSAKSVELTELYNHAMETGMGSKAIMTEVVRPDGTLSYVEIKPDVIIEDGQSVGSRGEVCDITERRNGTAALLNNNAWLSQILQGSSMPIMVINKDHTIIQWNTAYEKFAGIPASKMIGTKYASHAFGYNEDVPFVLDMIVDGVPDDEIMNAFPYNVEKSSLIPGAFEGENFHPHLGVDGKWTRFTTAPIHDPEGNIIGAMETVYDITENKRAEKALQESEDRFKTVFHSSPISISLTRLSNGELLDVNQEFLRVFGYTRQEVIGSTPLRLNNWVSLEDREHMFKLIHEQGNTKEFQTQMRTKTGEIKDVMVVSEVVELAGEKCLLGLTLDITERKLSETALKKERDQAQQFLDVAGVMLAVLNTEGEIVLINRKGCSILGYDDEAELLGRNWFETCLPKRVINETRSVFDAIITGNIKSHEYLENPVLTRMGDERVMAFHNSLLHNETSQVIGTLFSGEDITQRKQREMALHNLSLVDELTGISNRRSFQTVAEQALKIANRMQRGMLLLFSDMDDLKAINDFLGHPTGDQAIKEVAAVLKETYREADIVARLGGDEFVVLALEGTDEDANTMISRLQATLDSHNSQQGRRYQLSLSVGIARFDPEAPCSLTDLITQADRMMYRQKRTRQQRTRSGVTERL